jgi:hypothetical protein
MSEPIRLWAPNAGKRTPEAILGCVLDEILERRQCAAADASCGRRYGNSS